MKYTPNYSSKVVFWVFSLLFAAGSIPVALAEKKAEPLTAEGSWQKAVKDLSSKQKEMAASYGGGKVFDQMLAMSAKCEAGDQVELAKSKKSLGEGRESLGDEKTGLIPIAKQFVAESQNVDFKTEADGKCAESVILTNKEAMVSKYKEEFQKLKAKKISEELDKKIAKAKDSKQKASSKVDEGIRKASEYGITVSRKDCSGFSSYLIEAKKRNGCWCILNSEAHFDKLIAMLNKVKASYKEFEASAANVAKSGDFEIAAYKAKLEKVCASTQVADAKSEKPKGEEDKPADKKTAPPTDKKEDVAKADSKDQAKDPSANKEDGKQAPGQKSPEEIAKEDLTPKAAPYMAPTKILNGPAAAGEALKTAKEEAANGGGGTPPEKLEQADAGALASAGTDGKSEGMGDVADPGRAPTQAEITSEAKLAPLAEAEKKDWVVAQPVLDANRTVASNAEARKLATDSFGQDPVLSKYTIDYYSQKDTTAMQKAMNEVLGADSVSVDGRFGPQSYEKLNQIMQDPTKKAALYQALKKDEVWER